MQQKVLIVKLGFIETIDHGRGIEDYSVSLGDVFRTTAILHLFKNDKVSWLTTKIALPLLANNPYIDRILIYDLATALQLQAEAFDAVVNLEPVPAICALTDSIKGGRKYGFRFDARKGKVEAYEHSYEALANSDEPQLRKRMKQNWIELLYKMMGVQWRGENYVLGYKPKGHEKFDIGFNTNVNKRWRNKAWPMENWKGLERLIGNKYRISYQQSLDDIYGYIDWLNSCRLIVTNDSLGLHLAIALRKKIVALFGPTSEREVHLFGLGAALRPYRHLDCMPCFSGNCKNNKNCIDLIQPETVFEKIKFLLNRSE